MAADQLFPVPPSWFNSEQTSLWCVRGQQRRDHLPLVSSVAPTCTEAEERKGGFYKSEDSAFWGFYFGVRCQWYTSFMKKETPPLHDWGPLVAGPPPPPPPQDDREWIIVEGCSLSASPAATSAPLSQTLSDHQQPLTASVAKLWDLNLRPGPHLQLNSLFFQRC